MNTIKRGLLKHKGVNYLLPFILITTCFALWGFANDITNPINLLLYGMFERLSAITGLIDIPRQIFWFSDMGGSWMNSVGLKFSGDVAIWTVNSTTDC